MLALHLAQQVQCWFQHRLGQDLAPLPQVQHLQVVDRGFVTIATYLHNKWCEMQGFRVVAPLQTPSAYEE